MVIVLVVDSFKDTSNGTSMTAFRFFEALKKKRACDESGCPSCG